MDRRQMMLGAALGLATTGAQAKGAAGFASGGAEIAVEWFAAPGGQGRAPAVILLHGADGLTYADRYRTAAGLVAGAGFHVALVHYLDRTGERRVSYATLRERYPVWAATIRDGLGWISERPDVDPDRVGIIGVSLGAALALTTASNDRRVKAVVDFSGPLPEDLSAGALPPTLILHGDADRIVPSSNAYAIEELLKRSGTPYEIQVYPGQGHAFSGAAQFDAATRTAGFLDRYLGQA